MAAAPSPPRRPPLLWSDYDDDDAPTARAADRNSGDAHGSKATTLVAAATTDGTLSGRQAKWRPSCVGNFDVQVLLDAAMEYHRLHIDLDRQPQRDSTTHAWISTREVVAKVQGAQGAAPAMAPALAIVWG